METILEWIGFVLSVFGGVLVAYKQRTGFMVWIISNVILITFSILTNLWGLMLMYLFFLGTAILGWVKWKEEPIETNYG